jgi:glycine dehydrogenase subunit 1
MDKYNELVHPYIPNSVPEVKDEMLKEIGVKNVEDLLKGIPQRLRFKRTLDLPKSFPAEMELKNHVEEILSKNKTCKDYLNFLGAGCWQHYVPAVVDEIIHRAEFLTAYAGNTYSDLGKWQTFFEFQSMMGELLEMDVVSLPTFDWGSAAAFAIRMSSRMTGRDEVLVPKIISPERISIFENFCQNRKLSGHIDINLVNNDPQTGLIDLDDLKNKLSSRTAAIYIENPSYLGIIESNGEEISNLAHKNGSEFIVGVDPISLGILKPPVEYGADIVCGEIQPLGLHLNYGGGVGGFIASRDEAKYVSEYPLHLVSLAETENKKGFGFGFCTFDRTLYITREKGKDFTGTTVALWTIASAVYLALMGSKGLEQIGKNIIQKSHYAANILSKIDGLKIIFSSNFFKEFLVNFDKTGKKVDEINKRLLKKRIFGGKNITHEFQDFGNSAIYCITEIHSKNDIDRLAYALEEVVR